MEVLVITCIIFTLLLYNEYHLQLVSIRTISIDSIPQEREIESVDDIPEFLGGGCKKCKPSCLPPGGTFPLDSK